MSDTPATDIATPVDTAVHRSRWPLIGLVVLVCVVGTLLGGCFGHLAGSGYRILAHPVMHFAAYPDLRASQVSDYHPSNLPLPEDLKLFDRIGLYTGIVAGLLAAHLWCRLMFWLARRTGSARLVNHGTWVGITAGIAATLILHSILLFASYMVDVTPFVFGLVCAVIGGAIAGAICGKVFALVSGRIGLGGPITGNLS